MYNKIYLENLLIKGKRIIIKKFDILDLNAKFINNLNNKDLFKFSRHKNFKHTYLTSYYYYKNLPKNALYLIIKLKTNYQTIGTMTIYFKKNYLFADVGILISSKKHFRKGYGQEAWINVINYLQDKIRIKYITGGCKKENVQMINLFNKSFMTPLVSNSKNNVYYIKDNKRELK